MKVLLIGGGGREHAIAWKLAQSKKLTELLCAPGNAGMAQFGRCFAHVKATDIDGIVALAQAEKVDYVVVAPDDPLALGCVDALNDVGIPAFGPLQQGALMESSKSFAKLLMKKYHIPTAAFEVFDDYYIGLEAIKDCALPVWIKADGLSLGKGAIIAHTHEEAKRTLSVIMQEGAFGHAGNRVVVEECLTGPEVTLLCFVDGDMLVPMLPSQDHKRINDGDEGLNTGGMGAFAPSPLYTPEIAAQVEKKILKPTMRALRDECIDFRGILYIGLMLTPKGPYVIEYNARFGDPETQALLPLLKTDLLDIFLACTYGTLDKITIEWSDGACCCVCMASGGYPEAYEVGKPITGIKEAQDEGGIIFHAGTKQEDDILLTAGGRVLGVTALAPTIAQAADRAYAAAEHIHFENAHMRRDIGHK